MKSREPSRRRRWPLLVLIGALAVALLVGLIAIGGYFLLANRPRAPQGWQNPLISVDVARVRPDIAVLMLLDEAPGVIIQEALAANEPDSAYAALLYSASLSDARRSGNLLLIANAFEAVNAPDLAALCYQQMHSLAALSVTLPDVTRAESSLDAAEGLIRLGRTEEARFSLAQAETLARYSPLLAPIKRQATAERLAALYERLGFEAQARDLAQLVRNPGGLSSAGSVRGPFLPTFQEPIVLSQQLLEAQAERRAQVLAFLEAWDISEGSDIEAARTALASALLREDGVHQAVVAAELEASPQLAIKAAWLQFHINWLTLKLAIAQQALGLNLVPEWTLDAEGIGARLSQTYEDLFAIYGDQVAALPNADDVAFARLEMLRAETLLGRLGLYPNYAEEFLAESLAKSQQEVDNLLPLLVVHEPWGGGLVFRLAESFE